jgi:hypothetical protein
MLNKPIYVHLTDSAYDIGALLPQTALKTTPQKPKQSPARMTLGLARMIFPFSTSTYSLAQLTKECNSLGDAALTSQYATKATAQATSKNVQPKPNTASEQQTGRRLLINV